MQIKAFYDEPTYTVTYVVWDEATKDAVVIDPVLDYDPLASQTSVGSLQELDAFLEEKGLKLLYVLETHAHADHLSGSQYLKRKYGAGATYTDYKDLRLNATTSRCSSSVATSLRRTTTAAPRCSSWARSTRASLTHAKRCGSSGRTRWRCTIWCWRTSIAGRCGTQAWCSADIEKAARRRRRCAAWPGAGAGRCAAGGCAAWWA